MEREITKQDERTSFFILAVFLAPIMSVLIVGGFGFLVWVIQLILGPPGY